MKQELREYKVKQETKVFKVKQELREHKEQQVFKEYRVKMGLVLLKTCLYLETLYLSVMAILFCYHQKKVV